MVLIKDSRLAKGIRVIFLIAVIVLICGSVADFTFSPTNESIIQFVDLASIIFYTVLFLAYLIRKIKIPLCFGIIVYTFLLNFIVDIFFYDRVDILVIDFFRNSIFVGFLITISAYITNRYQPAILASIYVIACVIFYSMHHDLFFANYLFVLVGTIIAYAFILHFFVKVQETTLSDLSKSNHFITQLNNELLQQREEIVSQNDALEHQKNLIEERNKEIISGIRFARSIQQSVLPSESGLGKNFSGYFVFNRPKAVISGDFFWIRENQSKVFVAVVDCTGHGVPGALVSMVVNMILSRAFTEISEPNPSAVLQFMNKALVQEFKSNESFQFQIGMDIAMVSFDFSLNILEYSGAFNPILRIRNGELTQLAASRFIMGISPENIKTRFTNQTLDLQKGDKIYLFSDGFVDQFGGEHAKKFGYPRFRETLLSISDNDMVEQNRIIQARWKEWKGVNIQTDDILVLGVEI